MKEVRLKAYLKLAKELDSHLDEIKVEHVPWIKIGMLMHLQTSNHPWKPHLPKQSH